jgi:hypothetical protein
MKNSTKSTIVNDIKQLNSYTLESMLDVFNTTERKLTEDELAFYAELYKELESRKENPRFDHGGNIAQQNKEMLDNQAREVDHHIDELNNVLKNKVDVEPWVVAKMERATTDLSDITHYLDGEQKKEYSKPIYAEGGNVKIGGTIRLKNDLPYLASLDSLKGKDLKVKDIKHIYFASGSKLFYVVNHDGHEHEINEDFIEHKDKMASGGVIGKDITFNKWDETRSGTILELTDDGDYVVSSGAGSTLVSPEDVISFNEPKAKAKRFGFFEDGGSTSGLKVFLQEQECLNGHTITGEYYIMSERKDLNRTIYTVIDREDGKIYNCEIPTSVIMDAKSRYEDGGGVDDDFVIFSVDDDALDTLLNDNHRSELDYEDIHGDSYYKLNRRDFDRFIDYADSIGFDVDYENNLDAVVYVVNPRMAEGGMAEHGLDRGDTIVFNSGDEVMVVDKKDEQHLVDLDKGMRYEGGGTIEIGDKVKARKEYGGKSGVVVDKIGSFVVVENSKGVSESYHESDLIKKMANGGGVGEIEIKIWDEMNSNKRFHILDYQFPRGISKSKKQEYSMMKFNDLPFKIKNTIVIEEKYANGGGVGEQDKLETVLDNIFNGDYDEEEVDSLNVSQEMKDRINELSNLYSELNDAINDDDTKLENKLQKKVDKEYNYIIENAYKNKMANGGGVKEKSLYKDWDQFEKPSKIKVYLNNGKTLEINPLRLKGGKRVYDAILQAFIDDRFDITNKVIQGMTNNLSEDKSNPEVDKMANGGGVKEQITGETIISKVGDRNEIKKYVEKDLGIEKGTELDKYIYFDDASFVFIDKTVCKIGGVNSNPNLKLKEVSKLMKKAILKAGYKLNDKMADGGILIEVDKDKIKKLGLKGHFEYEKREGLYYISYIINEKGLVLNYTSKDPKKMLEVIIESLGTNNEKYPLEKIKIFEKENKMSDGGKIRKAPFKLGDMVYSYQNPNDKMRVSFIEDRGIIDGVDYGWNIKVALKTDSDGNYNPKGTYSKSSKWMSQNSVSKTKKEKYTTGGSMTGWKHKK